MAKNIFYFILLFSFGYTFSQTKVTYLKDSEAVFTNKTIKNAAFKNFENPINNGINNGVYWFKITNLPTEKTSIQIPNNRIKNVIAYQDDLIIYPAKHQRFITFNTKNKATFYFRVNVTREAFIPIYINTIDNFSKNEKKSFLLLGFYYGFAFVVFLINLFYYINFKDSTFFYYSLFLLAITFGLSISDGIYNFYGITEKTVNVLEIIDHFFVAVFGILFSYNYLQTENYYPKTKKILFFLAILVGIFGLIYIYSNKHIWYVITELLVFTILTYCWAISVYLFSKNIFTRVFTIAYLCILLFGLSFYITRLVGIPLTINASKLKLGAFFEMIVLSFAVIYRMKILQDENTKMREDIVLYSKKIQNLSKELQKTSKTTISNLADANLTIREQEILDFIIKGYSNKEIGEKLNISINTVKYHVKNIYDKLHIKSRREVKNLTL